MRRVGSMTVKEICQTALVVSDLRHSIQQFHEILGLSPWKVYTYAPPKLRDTFVRGKPEPFSMKVAFASVGSITLELIQPLEGNSIYREFLESHGDGLHHIASFTIDDMDKAIAPLEGRGVKVLQRGRYITDDYEAIFAYMDTEKTIGTIFEFLKVTGKRPPPEETYP